MTRACGAVIVDGNVLMVRHIHGDLDYWTLPGGGVGPGELPQDAAVREVFEETGLDLDVDRYLFTSTSARGVQTHCYLMIPPADSAEVVLGSDPEEEHLPHNERLLQDAQWHSLESKRDDVQVSLLIQALNIEVEM